MPRLIHALLCDDVRIERDSNKHIIIGLFDRFNVRDFSQPLPPFALFVLIGLENPGNHPVSVDLLSPVGEHTKVMDGEIPDKDEISPVYDVRTVNCVFRVGSLLIPEPGRYSFLITVDGEAIGAIPFVAIPK